MKVKEHALQEVKITAKRDPIWYKNLAVFEDHFLGHSPFGRQCELKNPEVLIIGFDTKTGVLEVTARDLLQIENEVPGYRIKYLYHLVKRTFDKHFSS